MATATRKTTPPPKAAPKPASRPATAAPSKAAQAAAAQGRKAPDEPRKPVPATPKPRQDVAMTPGASDVSLPAHMRGDANLGKESIGREDMEVPRLKLMQGVSPELEAYSDLRAGQFFHPAAEHIFEEGFIGVPIFMDRQHILWRPRDMGGGILARAMDGVHWSPPDTTFRVKLDAKDGGHEVEWTTAKTVQQSGLEAWGTMNPNDPNSPPASTLMYTFLLAFPEHPELIPAAFTFQRSSIKMGRKLNTKLKTVRTPLFGTAFRFFSVSDQNSKGQKFYNVDTAGAGLVGVDVGTPDMYEMYKQMHMQLRERGLMVKDLEGLQGEADDAEKGEGGDEGDAKRPNY